MEETISLKEIFGTVKKHLGLIITCTIVAALIAAVVSFFVLTPIYQSSTLFLVNQTQDSGGQDSINQATIRTNIELINTYNEIIRSEAILGEVVEVLNLTDSVGSLKNSVQVSSAQNSQVVTLSVKHTDPAMATAIANTTVEVFKDRIVDIMNVADNVSVISEAQTPTSPAPVAPNPKLNIAIAVVLGLMVGVGVAFLIEYLDTSVRTEEDIQEKLGITLLGVIPMIDSEDMSASRFTKTKKQRGGFNNVQTQKNRAQ